MPSISIDTKQVNRIRLATGICFFILVFFDLLRGQPGTFPARWQWLFQIVTNAFGPHGMTFVEAAIGITFIAWGLKKPSKKLNSSRGV